MNNWWRMSDFLIMKYNDARINHPTVGTSPGYPEWYTKIIGFNDDVHPVWVQPADKPSRSVQKMISGYVTPQTKLPSQWNPATNTWSSGSGDTTNLNLEQTTETRITAMTLTVSTFAALCFGVFFGRSWERHGRQDAGVSYSLLS